MLAKTPPMGWNSWNTFGPNINETVVMEMTDLMVEKGYKDAGYEYVVIAFAPTMDLLGATGTPVMLLSSLLER